MDVSHGQRIARNTFVVTAASIGQKILSFLYFTMIARTLGVEETGKYFFAISVASIFSTFVDLGLTHVLVREGAKKPEEAHTYLQNVFALKFLFSCFTALVLVLFLYFSRYSSFLIVLTLLASIAMIVDSWTVALYGFFRSRQALQYEAFGIIMGYVVTFVLGTAFLFFFRSLPLLLGALIAGSLFHILWASYILKRRFFLSWKIRWDTAMIHRLARMTIPFALGGIFVKGSSYIDTVLLSFLASERDIGLYSVPFKIAFAFQFLPMGFAAAIFPAMSSFTVSSADLLRKTFTKSMLYLFFLALPIAVGIWLLAHPIILTIYGPRYEASIIALRIIIFSLLFIFLNFPVGAFLNATNQQTLYTTLLGATMLVSVGANLLLIPSFGIRGAAFASVVSQGFLFITGMVAVLRSFSLDISALFFGFLKSMIAVAMMSLVVFLLLPLLHFSLVILLSGCVYLFMLLLLRAVPFDEVQKAFLSMKAIVRIPPHETHSSHYS